MTQQAFELVKILLDRGLLAVIALGAAHWLSRRLEAYRADRAMQNEMAKARVEAIAKCWHSLCDYEIAVKRAISEMHEAAFQGKPVPPDEQAHFNKSSEDCALTLNASRVWLDDRSEREFRQYWEAISELFLAAHEGPAERHRQAVQRIISLGNEMRFDHLAGLLA